MDLSTILRPYIDHAKESKHLSAAELVYEIKKQYALPNGVRLTNLENKISIAFGDLKLSFLYKRDLLKISMNKSESLYFGIKDSQEKQILPYLLNSGQAGINCALTYIKNTLALTNISTAGPTYIGTYSLSNLYHINLTSKMKESSVLWICSSALNDSDLTAILASSQTFEYIVIDTTCWSLDCEELSGLIEKFSYSTILLIRSISKLDMAGIEYGSLGSLAIIVPTHISPDKIEKDFDHIIKLTGSTPSLDDIPPYLFTKPYFNFISQRNQKLELVVNEIWIHQKWSMPGDTFVTFPAHRKYFLINFSRADHKNLSHNALLSLMQKLLYFLNIPGQGAPSFGFDECVYSIYSEEDSAILRICPGMGENRSKLIIQLVDLFFERLLINEE